MLGALGVAVGARRIRFRGRLMLAGGTAFGVLLVLFAASRHFVLSLGLLALTGCAMIVNNSLTNTLLQTTVPDHLRGRIMGFYSFVFVRSEEDTSELQSRLHLVCRLLLEKKKKQN